MGNIYQCLQDSSTALRSRNIGKLGELLAQQVLARNGFTNIVNLNEEHSNYKYADLLAERGNEKYVISVKTRNKNHANGKLNSASE